jgi:transposase
MAKTTEGHLSGDGKHGVYWIPVLEIMESSGWEVVLVDTRPLARVPGRKTDAEDCQWLQTLPSHGLLQGVYRPGEQISEVRRMVRQKTVLVRQQADLLRRMQQCLDQMNVRIHPAVKPLQGATGMAMLRAIVAGERDPQKLAKLGDAGCQKSASEMVKLLTGHGRSDHLFNLGQLLRQYDFLSEQIAQYEQEIERRLQELTPLERPHLTVPPLANREKRQTMQKRHQEAKRRVRYRMIGADLTAIDGIGVETAEVFVSEYGAGSQQVRHGRRICEAHRLGPAPAGERWEGTEEASPGERNADSRSVAQCGQRIKGEP